MVGQLLQGVARLLVLQPAQGQPILGKLLSQAVADHHMPLLQEQATMLYALLQDGAPPTLPPTPAAERETTSGQGLSSTFNSLALLSQYTRHDD